jgi:hypothetical protein
MSSHHYFNDFRYEGGGNPLVEDNVGNLYRLLFGSKFASNGSPGSSWDVKDQSHARVGNDVHYPLELRDAPSYPSSNYFLQVTTSKFESGSTLVLGARTDGSLDNGYFALFSPTSFSLYVASDGSWSELASHTSVGVFSGESDVNIMRLEVQDDVLRVDLISMNSVSVDFESATRNTLTAVNNVHSSAGVAIVGSGVTPENTASASRSIEMDYVQLGFDDTGDSSGGSAGSAVGPSQVRAQVYGTLVAEDTLELMHGDNAVVLQMPAAQTQPLTLTLPDRVEPGAVLSVDDSDSLSLHSKFYTSHARVTLHGKPFGGDARFHPSPAPNPIAFQIVYQVHGGPVVHLNGEQVIVLEPGMYRIRFVCEVYGDVNARSYRALLSTTTAGCTFYGAIVETNNLYGHQATFEGLDGRVWVEGFFESTTPRSTVQAGVLNDDVLIERSPDQQWPYYMDIIRL